MGCHRCPNQESTRFQSTAPAPPRSAFPFPRYNASYILFDNLAHGRGDRIAVTGRGGQRSYADLCADAAQFGNALLSLGLQRGDRVLMFLDDRPFTRLPFSAGCGPGPCRF